MINHLFSDVCRGYRKRIVAWNGSIGVNGITSITFEILFSIWIIVILFSFIYFSLTNNICKNWIFYKICLSVLLSIIHHWRRESFYHLVAIYFHWFWQVLIYTKQIFLCIIPVHYYNYHGNCWDASMFPVPRFASEYGYQSYPSYITLSQASGPSQLEWNSSLMFNRQHHQNGMYWIFNFIIT